MIHVWPWKISREFRAACGNNIAPDELSRLASAERNYKIIALFHPVFWFLMVYAMPAWVPLTPEVFSMVFRMGLIEVLVFCVLLVRLIFVFEKQFVSFGHKPKLWRTIGLTVLGFLSVSEMQRLSNLALKNQQG